jgi:hypothetical protein
VTLDHRSLPAQTGVRRRHPPGRESREEVERREVVACGDRSPQYKAQYEIPTVVPTQGWQHAFTVHTGEGGNQRKGMFYQDTPESTIVGYAQQIIRAFYNSGQLHTSHIGRPGHISLTMNVGRDVGYSRDTGQSTSMVRCALDLTASQAQIASIYPV